MVLERKIIPIPEPTELDICTYCDDPAVFSLSVRSGWKPWYRKGKCERTRTVGMCHFHAMAYQRRFQSKVEPVPLFL